jgi:predicted DNA-binding transcriptional regulator AlpA
MHTTIPDNWQARPVQKVEEASAILAISRSATYEFAKRRELDLVKLSARSSAITTASIVRFLAARGVEML